LPISGQAKQILDKVFSHTPSLFQEVDYPKMYKAIIKWIPYEMFHKKIRFHVSRHTFATIQLMNGTDIVTVQKLMGHKNISTTLRYVKIVDKLTQDAVERITLENLKF
jgi:site-specific recombinase XerD